MDELSQFMQDNSEDEDDTLHKLMQEKKPFGDVPVFRKLPSNIFQRKSPKVPRIRKSLVLKALKEQEKSAMNTSPVVNGVRTDIKFASTPMQLRSSSMIPNSTSLLNISPIENQIHLTDDRIMEGKGGNSATDTSRKRIKNVNVPVREIAKRLKKDKSKNNVKNSRISQIKNDSIPGKLISKQNDQFNNNNCDKQDELHKKNVENNIGNNIQRIKLMERQTQTTDSLRKLIFSETVATSTASPLPVQEKPLLDRHENRVPDLHRSKKFREDLSSFTQESCRNKVPLEEFDYQNTLLNNIFSRQISYDHNSRLTDLENMPHNESDAILESILEKVDLDTNSVRTIYTISSAEECEALDSSKTTTRSSKKEITKIARNTHVENNGKTMSEIEKTPLKNKSNLQISVNKSYKDNKNHEKSLKVCANRSFNKNKHINKVNESSIQLTNPVVNKPVLRKSNRTEKLEHSLIQQTSNRLENPVNKSKFYDKMPLVEKQQPTTSHHKHEEVGFKANKSHTKTDTVTNSINESRSEMISNGLSNLVTTAKRPRGRPKGSTNVTKPQLNKSGEKKRGRPKGSKNKCRKYFKDRKSGFIKMSPPPPKDYECSSSVDTRPIRNAGRTQHYLQAMIVGGKSTKGKEKDDDNLENEVESEDEFNNESSQDQENARELSNSNSNKETSINNCSKIFNGDLQSQIESVGCGSRVHLDDHLDSDQIEFSNAPPQKNLQSSGATRKTVFHRSAERSKKILVHQNVTLKPRTNGTEMLDNDSTEITPSNDVLYTRINKQVIGVNWFYTAPSLVSTGNDGIEVKYNFKDMVTDTYQHSFGYLIIPIKQEKPMQVSRKYNMSFGVMEGYGDVMASGKLKNFNTGDSFYIPVGTEYRIRNLGKTKLTLLFVKITM